MDKKWVIASLGRRSQCGGDTCWRSLSADGRGQDQGRSWGEVRVPFCLSWTSRRCRQRRRGRGRPGCQAPGHRGTRTTTLLGTREELGSGREAEAGWRQMEEQLICHQRRDSLWQVYVTFFFFFCELKTCFHKKQSKDFFSAACKLTNKWDQLVRFCFWFKKPISQALTEEISIQKECQPESISKHEFKYQIPIPKHMSGDYQKNRRAILKHQPASANKSFSVTLQRLNPAALSPGWPSARAETQMVLWPSVKEWINFFSRQLPDSANPVCSPCCISRQSITLITSLHLVMGDVHNF